MAPTTRSKTRSARTYALIKLLRRDRTHYGFTYTEGLNICPQPWNNKSCEAGGLYACELKDFFKWFTHHPDIAEVAWVEVPADARVARFDDKIKASKLVLTGFMPVHEAIHLAVRAGADLHAYNDYALLWVSMRGYAECMRALLEEGANVHTHNNRAIVNASYFGYTECVRLLLGAGADIHADNHALRHASCNGHIECVRLLLEAGANAHANNDEALILASRHGHLECVRLLRSS